MQIITVTAQAYATVISENIIDGGRERHENGRDPLEPGKARQFIIDDNASIRVVMAQAPEDQVDPEIEAANAEASRIADEKEAEMRAKAEAAEKSPGEAAAASET